MAESTAALGGCPSGQDDRYTRLRATIRLGRSSSTICGTTLTCSALTATTLGLWPKTASASWPKGWPRPESNRACEHDTQSSSDSADSLQDHSPRKGTGMVTRWPIGNLEPLIRY